MQNFNENFCGPQDGSLSRALQQPNFENPFLNTEMQKLKLVNWFAAKDESPIEKNFKKTLARTLKLATEKLSLRGKKAVSDGLKKEVPLKAKEYEKIE